MEHLHVRETQLFTRCKGCHKSDLIVAKQASHQQRGPKLSSSQLELNVAMPANVSFAQSHIQ